MPYPFCPADQRRQNRFLLTLCLLGVRAAGQTFQNKTYAFGIMPAGGAAPTRPTIPGVGSFYKITARHSGTLKPFFLTLNHFYFMQKRAFLSQRPFSVRRNALPRQRHRPFLAVPAPAVLGRAALLRPGNRKH
jgi:hypothetical protein